MTITYKEIDEALDGYLAKMKAKAESEGMDNGCAYAAACGGMQYFIAELMFSNKDESAVRRILKQIQGESGSC